MCSAHRSTSPGHGRTSAVRPRRSRTIDARTRAIGSCRRRPGTGSVNGSAAAIWRCRASTAWRRCPSIAGRAWEAPRCSRSFATPGTRERRSARCTRPSSARIARSGSSWEGRSASIVSRWTRSRPTSEPTCPSVVELDPDRDLVGLRACYREWVRHGNGSLEPTDDDWWMRRILRPFGDAISRAVVVRATTVRSRGSRRSDTPTRKAATWRSTSAWSAWRSPRPRSARHGRCSPTSARSAAWACGSSGAVRRRIPSRCWCPSSRSRRRSGSAGCSGCSTCGARWRSADTRRSTRTSRSRWTTRRSPRTRVRGG